MFTVHKNACTAQEARGDNSSPLGRHAATISLSALQYSRAHNDKCQHSRGVAALNSNMKSNRAFFSRETLHIIRIGHSQWRGRRTKSGWQIPMTLITTVACFSSFSEESAPLQRYRQAVLNLIHHCKYCLAIRLVLPGHNFLFSQIYLAAEPDLSV